MNPAMWAHPATVRNVAQLRTDGVHIIGPEMGNMAERDETGYGRMSEPLTIVAAIEALLNVHENLSLAAISSLPLALPTNPLIQYVILLIGLRVNRVMPLQPLLRIWEQK